MRRSMLFIPGANPKQVMFAATLGADCVIMDLEDAVSPVEKIRHEFWSATYLPLKITARLKFAFVLIL